MKIGYHVADLKFEKKRVPFTGNFSIARRIWSAYREDPGSSRAEPGPPRIHGRSGHGTGPFPVFPCHRSESEADLRTDRDCRHFRGSSGRRHQVRHRWAHRFRRRRSGLPKNDEIISKSPSVFIGYYKMPEETKKTLKDGWLYSGDTGFIDEDGHLVVFDRSKDVMILSDGRKFSPSSWRPVSSSARTSGTL